MMIFDSAQSASFGLVLGLTIIWIGYLGLNIIKQSWSKEVQGQALTAIVYVALTIYIGQAFYLDYISRAPIPLKPLPEISIQELKNNGASVVKLKNWMDEHIGYNTYPSLQIAISDNSNVIFSYTAGNPEHLSQKDSAIYPVASVSKFFTNLLCIKLSEEGVLDLDAPLIQYLPENINISPQPDLGKKITIGMLMTHMSGLVRSPGVIRSNDNAYRDLEIDRVYKRLSEEELRFKPGTDRSYSNLGSGILGIVIQKVSKQSYEELIQSHFAKPLGMKDTYILDYTNPEQQQRLTKPHIAGLGSPIESQPVLRKRLIGSGGVVTTAHNLSILGSTILTAKNLNVSQERYDQYLSPISYRNEDGSLGKKSPHTLISRTQNIDKAGTCFNKNGGRKGVSAYLIICPDIGVSIGITANRSVRPYEGSPDQIGDILMQALSSQN